MSTTENAAFQLRPGRPEDVAQIVRLIRVLAEHEQMLSQCRAEESIYRQHLFGPKSFAETIVAEVEGRVVGLALFLHNYSAFLAKPGLYLDDIVVDAGHRGRGIGKALFRKVIEIARERGCGRVEWSVLDGNRPAIEFYEKTFDAQPVKDWITYRLTEEGFSKSVRGA